jgi:D-alanyl-lipoteichoic acid acyltransferase DltB (MBOAT superfamily)
MKKCGLFVVVTIVIGIIGLLINLFSVCVGIMITHTKEGQDLINDTAKEYGLHFIGSNKKKISTTNEIGFKAY